MNILRILAFRLGMVTFALILALGAKVSFAETMQVGQYFAEVRGLVSQSSAISFQSSQITGFNNNLEKSGSELQADAKDLEVALTDLKADVTETEIQVNLSADVLFDFDKSNIKPEADSALRKVALIIAEKRRGNVVITGHTDAKGSDNYNQKLSEQRAQSVRDWFVAQGQLSGVVILTLGMGEGEPVAPNINSDGSDNPDGRKLNRRVGIVIETK